MAEELTPLIKNRARFLLVSLVIAALLLGGALVASASRQSEPEPDSLYKYLSVFTEVLGLVRQAYVEETDVQSLMAGAYEGTADALDAFSIYVPVEKADRYRAVRSAEALDLGLFLMRERGWVYVGAVTDGSTAEVAGLEQGDLVSRMNGESTRELEVWELEERLWGEGDSIELEILRRGESIEIELPLTATESTAVRLDEIDTTPRLRIARFGAGTAEAVAEALAEVQDRGSLLVDVRGVAGGEVDQALAVADLWLDGKLGSLQSKGQVQQSFDSRTPVAWQGDVVVLVDRGTLGAAELFALALKEGMGARLVGEPTYGWAGHSRIITLSSGALLVLTDGFYAGPGGDVIDGSLAPDLRVTGRDRKLREKDLSLDELILRRGLELLAGDLEVDPVVLEEAA